MDKKVAGAIGAFSALAALDAAHAAPATAPNAGELPRAQSFAELLQPIPNALAKLRAVDEASAAAGVRFAQYYYYPYRHHHHAQWRYGYGWRPRYWHHHHHGWWRY